MYREEEHILYVVESVLRAVTVMNVPVHDQDTFEALHASRVARSDGDVVEEAEAHPVRGRRVVAGLSAAREGVLDIAINDRVHRVQDAARRKQGNVVRLGSERRVVPQTPSSLRRNLADHLDVLGMVDNR